jgi:hypothetical protein
LGALHRQRRELVVGFLVVCFVVVRVVVFRVLVFGLVVERSPHRRKLVERVVVVCLLVVRLVVVCLLVQRRRRRVTPPAPGGSAPVAGGFGSTDAKGRPLPAVARALYALVAFVAFVGTVAAVAAADLPSSRTWLQFALLTCCAAIAQLFNIRTGRNTSFHTAPAFVAAAVLLLPPELVALMLVLQHVPDWIKERFPAYIQSFNIANYVVSALAAWSAAHALLGADALGAAARPVAGIAAAIVLVLLNHLLLALMLRFGRGHSLRASGLFTAAALGPDLALVALGVALAEILRVEMWLAPALLIPLFLTHRSLASLALTRARSDYARSSTLRRLARA